MHDLNLRHPNSFSIWFAYLFFVAYGSLVPLNFQPLPIDQAWSFFQHMPMFRVATRTDWIANVVLSIPTGFLTAHLLLGKFSNTSRALILFLAGLFSIAFVTSVEFAQIFFPPRTSSLNDIVAQAIGSVIGLLLAAKNQDWFKNLLDSLFSNPSRLPFRLLEVYLVGYVAFSLFPFDILLSGAELEQKIGGDHWGWLLSASNRPWTIKTAIKLLSEIILTLPFGLFLGYRTANRYANYKQAILLGLFLGGSIEIAQFFIASGISEGLSVLTRIAGVCGGLALWHRRANWSPERLAALIQRYSLPGGLIYFLAILQVNGWFSHPWRSSNYAVNQLNELHFLPFYYHYYTTEAKALFSLAGSCLMYLPIGLLIWSNRGTPLKAFVITLLAASIVETGKLFLQGMHPDPTNILLGALASWGIVHLANALSAAATMPSTSELTKLLTQQTHFNASQEKCVPLSEEQARRPVAYAILLSTLAFTMYWAATFPTQPLLLCLFLTGCAAMIWYRPVLLVAILPAALPVLDLAPWSGRFYFDEFDLLVLISLAIGYTRIPLAPQGRRQTDTLFTLASGLVAISFLISAMRGLSPWHPPDANAFTNYYSPFNALRIVKGALWAFLTYGLLRRLVAAEIDYKRPLALGMTTGLALTVAVILWERLTFSGLFNFTSDYRVTGPFSSMHTGGAYIECFLVIATPFLTLLILQTKNWLGKMLGAILLLATTYALMVTFSRNGYSAFGIALAIFLFFATFKSGRWQQRILIVAALAGAILVVAIPVFTGQFAQDRMATLGKDLADRQTHWVDAINIRTPKLLTTLFGMGLGRYPEAHYLFSSDDNRSGTYQLITEDQNTFLRLVPGNSIFMGQKVSVEPRQKYLLKLDARTNKPDATITIPICEKWLLSSYACMWSTFEFGKVSGTWRHFEIELQSDQLNKSHWYSQRPIKLALYNGNSKALIDVDNVRLETIKGDNLLRNGDFSKELDHWFFSADSHLQWHIKSLPIAVLYDQGWFGLIAVFMFSILAIKRSTFNAWRGDLNAAAALASFCGFLEVGLFDTLIDAPRFLFLFLLLGGFSSFGNTITSRHGEAKAL